MSNSARRVLGRSNEAVDAYLAIPLPDTSAMFDHLYEALLPAMRSNWRWRSVSRVIRATVMADLNMVEALNQALAYELTHDPAVALLGEDIGVNGGVFRHDGRVYRGSIRSATGDRYALGRNGDRRHRGRHGGRRWG